MLLQRCLISGGVAGYRVGTALATTAPIGLPAAGAGQVHRAAIPDCSNGRVQPGVRGYRTNVIDCQ
jgi:hypothetical protein